LDCKQVEKVSLLSVRLVIWLVVGLSFQLESLSTGTILGLGTGEAVWSDWIVLNRNLGDEQPLWWIYLEHCEIFGI